MKDNFTQSTVPLTTGDSPKELQEPWLIPGYPSFGNPPPNAPLLPHWNPGPFKPAPWRPVPLNPSPWDRRPMPIAKPFYPWGPPPAPMPTIPALPGFENTEAQKVEEHALYKQVQAAVSAIPKRSKKKETKRTHIIFVLDQSSSMDKGKGITVSGFNEQVDIVQQRKKGAGRTTISLALFNNHVHISYAYQKTASLAKLTDQTYKPDGMTALYDAIGEALKLVIGAKGFSEKNTAFFVAIFTDGGENRSQICTGPVISKCMSMLEETGRVTFSFMGPNAGLKSIGDVLKVTQGNTAGFNPESLDSRSAAFASMASATRSYLNARSEGATSVCNLYTGGKCA